VTEADEVTTRHLLGLLVAAAVCGLASGPPVAAGDRLADALRSARGAADRFAFCYCVGSA
jgi:hypothetical protein